jgi:hypothetical protein
MTDTIEAARRALYGIDDLCWDQDDEQKVHTILTAITPLIRAAALEEAAMVAEEHIHYSTNFGPEPPQSAGDQIAAGIRALKEQP